MNPYTITSIIPDNILTVKADHYLVEDCVLHFIKDGVYILTFNKDVWTSVTLGVDDEL